jgi:hypothetical protein
MLICEKCANFGNDCECVPYDVECDENFVEKLQIPKKVIVHGIRPDREVNTVSFTCPNCNSHLSRQSVCPECNQVLDWSDLE